MKRILSMFILVLVLSACSIEDADISMSSSLNESEIISENETSSEIVKSDTSDQVLDLSVEGTNIVDENGQVVNLHGVSTHGINWFPEYVNYDMFKQLKSNGINTVRIAMYTEDYNGYTTLDDTGQNELLKLIDDAVNYAVDLNMYIIIDWHILNDNNPLNHKSEAGEFFQLMSEKYGNLNNVIFEICNEPNGDTTWADITEYANYVIPKIRENSNNLIIVGTPNWSQDVDVASESPLDFTNVLYGLHFYSGTHKQELRDKAQIAIDNQLPLFVSEFGVSDASGNGSINTDEAEIWLEFLGDNNISYIMWNLSNKDESSSLIKATESNISNIGYDQLTEGGQWYYDYLNKDTSVEQEEAINPESKEKNDNSIAEINLVNSWDDSYQYEVIINNNSSKDIDGWKIELVSDIETELVDSWNGEFILSDKHMTISNVNYNSQVEANSSLTDIGFIVTADSQPTFTIKA